MSTGSQCCHLMHSATHLYFLCSTRYFKCSWRVRFSYWFPWQFDWAPPGVVDQAVKLSQSGIQLPYGQDFLEHWRLCSALTLDRSVRPRPVLYIWRIKEKHRVLPVCISSPLPHHCLSFTPVLFPTSTRSSLHPFISTSHAFQVTGEAIVLSVLADNESWWETFLWVLADSGKLPIQPALHTNEGGSSTTLPFFFFFLPNYKSLQKTNEWASSP